ncbi:proline-rich receptor-like protein kinase PERK8 [Phaseolus vulgaris]|uniref:proline-rich receptor-like protein kinase PERK8 n=1 Tax=Phaseolus vulgaris TaxID=3885 RepID=UPI0035C947E1
MYEKKEDIILVIVSQQGGHDSIYTEKGSVMDASKRMMLAKAMKAARAAKAGASSAPAADPNPPSTLPPPPPTTTEAPLGSSSPSPHSPEALHSPGCPPPIAAVPLDVASSPAPTPLDKGKRVLEIISDDGDSDGVAPFKRRKAARVPLLPAASPQGEDSFRDNPPSATSLPPAMVQEEAGEDAESAPPPPPVEVSTSPASVAAAPDLIAIPPLIMHLMRGFSGGSMPKGSDRKEGMPFYLGAFLAVALEWRAQARNVVL